MSDQPREMELESFHARSQLDAFGKGAWRGAKRGFIIVAGLAVVIGAVGWSLVHLVLKRSSLESGLKELPLFPVAVGMYGLGGAVIGALVMGAKAGRRFKELQLAAPANTGQPHSPALQDQPSADDSA
jgi:hypothetical protein